MNPTYKDLHPLFIALLDDPNGISEEAFRLMAPMLDSSLINAVESSEGRYFINEDYAEQVRNVDLG